MIYEKPFVLTASNYHGREANKKYFSVSQLKSFLDCPARTMAELNGEWEREPSSALLIGSYVDAAFESESAFRRFCDDHDVEIHYKSKADKKLAEFIKADEMIRRAKSDPVFMEYMKGEHQVIRTATLFGVPWKAKLDVLNGKVRDRSKRRIVDLKTTRDFLPQYKPGQGRMNFIDYWGYTLQGAIYQLIEGHHYPFFIAAISKEDPPDIAIIEIPQARMDAEIEFVAEHIERFKAIKAGIIEPDRCENCAYCRATRKLTRPLTLDELDFGIEYNAAE